MEWGTEGALAIICFQSVCLLISTFLLTRCHGKALELLREIRVLKSELSGLINTTRVRFVLDERFDGTEIISFTCVVNPETGEYAWKIPETLPKE